MAADEILISALPQDRRAAARLKGDLVQLVFDAGCGLRLGDLRVGRITALAPALGGAFVDIGAAQPGLLMQGDLPDRRLAEGETVAVRVVRLPVGNKGAKLDARLPDGITVPASMPAPGLIAPGEDPIVALVGAAAGGAALRRVVVDDPSLLSALRATVPAAASILELWRGPRPLFEAEGIDEAVGAALAAEVPLPSGGRVIIAETEAIVAIDVDSGATAAASPRSAALACNIEAAVAIGRHIRLRDLAGPIVVDFVPLRRRAERERVVRALQQALAADDRRWRIAGWTNLGLLEMVRERRGPSLRRRLTGACPACSGDGAVRDARWVAGDALRAALAAGWDPATGVPAVMAAPAVAAALRENLGDARRAVEERLGCPLAVHADPALAPDAFRLTTAAAAR